MSKDNASLSAAHIAWAKEYSRRVGNSLRTSGFTEEQINIALRKHMWRAADVLRVSPCVLLNYFVQQN